LRASKSVRKLVRVQRPQASNVDGFWSTERLKKVMRECFARTGFWVSPSMWRQLYPAIQRMYCPSTEDTLDQV